MIEVNKSTLAGAMTALGKLICRTSPLALCKSIKIEAAEGELRLSTCGLEEEVSFQAKIELGEDSFCCMAGFDEFRDAVRSCRNKTVSLSLESETLQVGDRHLMTVKDVEWPDFTPAAEAKACELPENVVGMFAQAAQIVNRNEPRAILRGINLSADGITVTNGKELLNYGIPLDLGSSLTIPLPLALLQSKNTESGTLSYWPHGSEFRLRIQVGPWSWTGKTLPGMYPNWKSVVPDEAKLEHRVNFTAERAEQMKHWLKNLPDEPVILTRSSDDLVLRDQHGSEIRITAYFVQWDDYRLAVNSSIMLRLLNEGHTSLACPEEHGPFLASRGAGRYIAMPLHQPQAEPKEEPKETQSNQEENKMETPTPVVSAPMQTAAPKVEPETCLNPLDDLTASIEAFKLKLKASFDEVSSLARKVKEVQIAQKQKERDFIQAKRAIERIRMVSGF